MLFDLDAWDGQVFSIPTFNIIRATDEKTLRDFALVLANDEAAFKTYFSWVASILTDDDPIEYYAGYVTQALGRSLVFTYPWKSLIKIALTLMTLKLMSLET